MKSKFISETNFSDAVLGQHLRGSGAARDISFFGGAICLVEI